MTPAVAIAGITLLAVMLLMAGEAALSAHNESALRARGAVEPPDDVIGTMRWAYPLCFVGMAIEGAIAGPSPRDVMTAGLALFGLAKALKISAISALGSGWFVALAFAILGLLALSRGRRDLAFLLALGTLCFPMEWALKYFTSAEVISLPTLISAMFDVNGVGLDDLADFPAGHALRATVLYGLTAFCVARLAHDHRQGYIAYGVAGALIVAIHVLRVDERARAREANRRSAVGTRRVAVPRREAPPSAAPETIEG